VPHGWDQFDNAWRLQNLGVARSCPSYRLYEGPLYRHLRALLQDPGVCHACQAAAQRLAGGSDSSSLCRRIEAKAAALPPP